jgi:hypothetical protein
MVPHVATTARWWLSAARCARCPGRICRGTNGLLCADHTPFGNMIWPRVVAPGVAVVAEGASRFEEHRPVESTEKPHSAAKNKRKNE